jgi:hypothetical protein
MAYRFEPRWRQRACDCISDKPRAGCSDDPYSHAPGRPNTPPLLQIHFRQCVIAPAVKAKSSRMALRTTGQVGRGSGVAEYQLSRARSRRFEPLTKRSADDRHPATRPKCTPAAMLRSISTEAVPGFVRDVRYSTGTPARSKRARLLVSSREETTATKAPPA